MKVSFRSYHPEMERGEYREWMLTCKGRDKRFRDDSYFLISRAYSSNRVFVHKWTVTNNSGEIFLLMLSSNISIFDTGNKISQGRGTRVPQTRRPKNEASSSQGYTMDINSSVAGMQQLQQRVMNVSQESHMSNERADILRDSLSGNAQSEQYLMGVSQANQQGAYSQSQNSGHRTDLAGVATNVSQVDRKQVISTSQQYIEQPQIVSPVRKQNISTPRNRNPGDIVNKSEYELGELLQPQRENTRLSQDQQYAIRTTQPQRVFTLQDPRNARARMLQGQNQMLRGSPASQNTPNRMTTTPRSSALQSRRAPPIDPVTTIPRGQRRGDSGSRGDHS